MRRETLEPVMPEGAKFVDPDSEQLKRVREIGRQAATALFGELWKRGNSQSEALVMVEFCLGQIEHTMVEGLTAIPAFVVNRIALWNLVATVTLRVLKNNPLYDSPALTLQLQNELDQALETSPGIIVEKKVHG